MAMGLKVGKMVVTMRVNTMKTLNKATVFLLGPINVNTMDFGSITNKMDQVSISIQIDKLSLESGKTEKEANGLKKRSTKKWLLI